MSLKLKPARKASQKLNEFTSVTPYTTVERKAAMRHLLTSQFNFCLGETSSRF